tara:strand:- start:64 stop:195 length:132 start_codon:yes stop_codon:yes gene_type:complete
MKYQRMIKRNFNFNDTEKAANTMLATLILSGWLVSLIVYLITT